MNWFVAALRYARFGFFVLPVEPGGKRPLLKHGVKDATRLEPRIEEWARRWPSANLAIAVTPPLAVLDVDPRSGGDKTLARILEAHGPLPATKTARTGGGGAHHLFLMPSGVDCRGKLGPGLDFLHGADEQGFARRYILVAPSVTAASYAWDSPPGTPIAKAPAWLVELATRRSVEPAPCAPASPSSPDAFDRARRYLEKIAPAISGANGHAHTFVVAQRLVRGFGLSDGESLELLRNWNKSCSPPWSEHELRRKVRQARERGTMPHGALLEGRRAS
ncbi:MAG: bifunctional DNA primase/polymerase [Myxococcales bacterium]|nr:bifunctional DNA primase/polymerase [Myxococcales bacterium]